MSNSRHTPPGDFSARLKTSRLGRQYAYHATIGSTQDEARELARNGAAHGYLVWAGEQTAGRGRLQRRWHSPSLSGLWFSVILRPSRPATDMAALPLAAGVAVASTLARRAPGIGLKWPNDVLLGGAKVAGILVEAQTHAGSMQHAVVGVGINLFRPAEGFHLEIRESAAALVDALPGVEVPALLADLLAELEACYDQLLREGPASTRRRWLALADTIGREVTAHLGGRTITGTAVDLDTGGNLVLEVQGERVVIPYGEIEHLR